MFLLLLLLLLPANSFGRGEFLGPKRKEVDSSESAVANHNRHLATLTRRRTANVFGASVICFHPNCATLWFQVGDASVFGRFDLHLALSVGDSEVVNVMGMM